jgi:peptidoglycan-associated lipoprotein
MVALDSVIKQFYFAPARRSRDRTPQAQLHPQNSEPHPEGLNIMLRIKYLSVFAVVALLAACDTTPKDGSGAGGAGSMSVRPGSQEDLAQNVGDRVFFGSDRSDLTTEARSTLNRQSQWLKTYPQVTITIEGHADERGTREYNLALGERRANAVKSYLIAQGVQTTRVKTISYGKERPAVLGSDESAWAQNRRGVTMVD